MNYKLILILMYGIFFCDKKKNTDFYLKNLSKKEINSLTEFHNDFQKLLDKYGFYFPSHRYPNFPNKEFDNFIEKFYYERTDFMDPDSSLAVYAGKLESKIDNIDEDFAIVVYFNIIDV